MAKTSKQFQKKLKKLEKEEKINTSMEWKPTGFQGHQQHNKEFIKELNSVQPKFNTRTLTPINDKLEWKIGKYKGINLSDTPIEYIKWAHKNMRMPPITRSILEKYT